MKGERIIPPEFATDVPIPEGLKKEDDFSVKIREKTSIPELLREVSEGGKIYKGPSLSETVELYKNAGEQEIVETFKTVLDITKSVKDAGGQALMVGGFVRDTIMGFQPKDIDVEVYGLSASELEKVLSTHGRVEDVGKAFGILKVVTPSGLDIDVSLPRTDSKIDIGHRGFAINVDPTMSVKEAARRRDFTFNTVAQDPTTGEIYDYFGGVEDAANRVLRVTDKELFKDDPLRVMRGAQFTSRFNLMIEDETASIVREMVPRLREIPYERMSTEWEKLLVKSPQPSIGLQTLASWGILYEFYPELDVLRATPQEFEWHPEGTVWVHTLMVVDQAKRISERENLSYTESFDLIIGALCHDVGKAITTQYEEKKGEMRFTSHGHERAGYDRAKLFLEKFSVSKKRKEKILNMVTEHMMPGALYMHFMSDDAIARGESPKKAVRRLRRRLGDSTSIKDIALVGEADALGRGPFTDPKNEDQHILLFSENGRWLMEQAKKFALEEKPEPIIRGRDLLKISAFRSLKPARRPLFADFIRVADRMHDALGLEREEILNLIVSGANEKKLEDVLQELEEVTNNAEKSEEEIQVEQRSYDSDYVESEKNKNKETQVHSAVLSYIQTKKRIKKMLGSSEHIQGDLFEELHLDKKEQENIKPVDIKKIIPDIQDKEVDTIVDILKNAEWHVDDVKQYVYALQRDGIDNDTIVEFLKKIT